MKTESLSRLFDPRAALNEPITLWITVILAVVLLLIPLVTWLLSTTGKVSAKLHDELVLRYYGWLLIIPVLIGPIMLGAFWAILGIGLLSLFCYREYAQATGLTRERWVSFLIVGGILLLTVATLDHWYGLFTALTSLTVASIVAFAVLQDRPQGYIQRVALAVFGYLLFGVGLGHLAYLANDTHYRSLMLLIFVAVELNDVFAFCCGKTFGRRKLCPNTSPNKTVGGAAGALVLTTILVVVLGRHVFAGTALAGTTLASVSLLIGLGALTSIAGQFGDLTLSSIKRDLGIKDMAATIPGHGGLLDRFDSILLAAPVFFHYVRYFVGIGENQPQRLLTNLFGFGPH
ncbi:MAG: phosphatidate cytidylyltransferase [Planctomycetia bacterium]|nr:phosphatidate cytidylyltransferase [Planctomycetia bacterium]